MAIHVKDSTAVIKNGDRVMILVDTDAETTVDLRGFLAAVNSASYVGGFPGSVRQLLHDVEGALDLAYRKRRRVPTPRTPGES